MIKLKVNHLLFFIVVASATSYKYSSTKWETVSGDSGFMNNYILCKEGKISNFSAKLNNLTFSMEISEIELNKSASYLQVNAILPLSLFDGSLIPELRIQNIPITLRFSRQLRAQEQLNLLPNKAVIKQATFQFENEKMLIGIEGNVYQLDLLVGIQKIVKYNSSVWMIIYFTNLIFQLFLIVNSINTGKILQYKFLTIFNTIAGYQIYIVLKNLQLQFIQSHQANMFQIIFRIGPLVSTVLYVFRPSIAWQKASVGLLLLGYGSLIATGYIGELLMFTQMILQQVYIRIYQPIQLTQKQIDCMIILASSTLCRLIAYCMIYLIWGNQFCDLQKLYLCLLFLLLVANQMLIPKRQKMTIIAKFKTMQRNLMKNIGKQAID